MSIDTVFRKNTYLFGKFLLRSKFYGNLKKMQSAQFLTREENQAMQRQALKQLLKVAYRQIPYYRKIFKTVGLVSHHGDINFDAFTNLPPLTKEDIRNNEEMLLNTDIYRRHRIIKLPSGGTTGDQVAPYGDSVYWDWCLAETWLFYNWMGLKTGMPYFYFWGAPQDLGSQSSDFKSWFWINLIQNRYTLNCRILSPEIMRGFIRQINTMPNHRYMVASVHELYELACFSLEHNLEITTQFKGISVTTSELTEPMRESIEKVFNCPVYSRYGCREAGDIASECIYQSGLHINPLYSFVEVVDKNGTPVPYGEEGRILVTNLHNELMPLIRYEIQDLGKLQEPALCRCGRAWESFSQITGRLHERLDLPDGSTFGKVFLHYAMEVFTNIKGYQLHHTGKDEIEIHLLSSVKDYLHTHHNEVQKSYDRLTRCTHNQFTIRFLQVDRLEQTSSGKRLVIIKKSDSEKRENELLTTC